MKRRPRCQVCGERIIWASPVWGAPKQWLHLKSAYFKEGFPLHDVVPQGPNIRSS